MEVSNPYDQYGAAEVMRQMQANAGGGGGSSGSDTPIHSRHQPLPLPPPPQHEQQNGDAHYNYETFPMPFSLKMEPEDPLDGSGGSQMHDPMNDENLMQPMYDSQGPNSEGEYYDLPADVKQRLYQSGFTPYSRDDPILKPFKCPICGKAFGRLSHVRRHQLLHTGEKPFECEICHEKFTRVENRTRHMAIHTGERRHNCQQCGKGFSQLNRLNVHIRIHSGERPFVCEICGKAFGRIDHKNCHMRTHNWIRDKQQTATMKNEFKMEATQPPPPPPPSQPMADEKSPIDKPPDDPLIDIHKPFKCPTCGKQFARKDHLNRHIFIHSGTKPFKCDICSKLFSRKDNKYKHMASCIYMHFGIIIVKRPPAGSEIYSIEDTKSLESKINEKLRELQDGNILPKSQLLSPKANLMHALELNAVQSSSSSQYGGMDDMMEMGAGGINQKDNMKLPQSKDGAVEILLVRPDIPNARHQYHQHQDLNEAEIQQMGEIEIKTEIDSDAEQTDGGVGLTDSYSMSEYNGMQLPRAYQCEFCDKSFMHKSHLVRHALVHSGEKPFKCDQCEKSFYRKEHLQRHVITHTGIKPYKCNFCDKSFMQVGQQMKHILQHVNGETQFLTSDRNNLSGQIGQLQQQQQNHQHQQAAGMPRMYHCDRCDKVYARKSHLKRHYTVHTGEKPYKCELCGQGFSRLEHKKRHMTIHTHLKKYACEFCDKKFARPDHMLVHIKRHSGVLPYKCNQCGCRFNTSKEKVEHLRTHTGAYRCEICAERFELYVDLAEHRDRKHQQQLPQKHDSTTTVLDDSAKSEILVNAKEKFPCPICYQRFDVLSLSEHLKTHVQKNGPMMMTANNNDGYAEDEDNDDDEEFDEDDVEDTDDEDRHSGRTNDHQDLSIVDMCAVKIELNSSDEEDEEDDGEEDEEEDGTTAIVADGEIVADDVVELFDDDDEEMIMDDDAVAE